MSRHVGIIDDREYVITTLPPGLERSTPSEARKRTPSQEPTHARPEGRRDTQAQAEQLGRKRKKTL